MATTYTSTLEIRCWKQHTCAACGALYSYLFVRKITGSGSTADRARVKAQANVSKAMATDVDVQPCPTCGLVQPDMIGQQRARRHKTVFWIALILLVALIILRLTNVLQADVATWALVGICAVSA